MLLLLLMALFTKNVIGSQCIASMGIIMGAITGYVLMYNREEEE
jgi:membrane protein YqaA with SNARE-associated domain